MLKRSVIIIFLFAYGISNSQSQEFVLKSHFVDKFIYFINWPTTNQNNISKDSVFFNIKVIGENSFDDSLETVFRNKKIKNKKIKIHYIDNLEEITNCDILFISSSKRDSINHIVAYTKGKSILLIGDSEGFASEGVHLNFFLKKGQIRFEINPEAIRDSNLEMDYKLLKLGEIVTYNNNK